MDKRGDPVRHGIMSTDTRASSVVDRWMTEPRCADSTPRVQQRFWAGQPAPLLTWLDRYEPDMHGRMQHLLFCKDFLRATLCGEFSTNPTDAGLGGFGDITRQAYALNFLGGWTSRKD